LERQRKARKHRAELANAAAPTLQTFGRAERTSAPFPRHVAGVPIERVSILLDHHSVRITEKHYAPWVRSRQEQLEADLANAWSRDPLVLLQSGVHQRYTPSGAPTTHLSSISKDWCPGWESNPHEEKSPEDFKCHLPLRISPCMSTTNTDSSGFTEGLRGGQCPSDSNAVGRIGKIRQSDSEVFFIHSRVVRAILKALGQLTFHLRKSP